MPDAEDAARQKGSEAEVRWNSYSWLCTIKTVESFRRTIEQDDEVLPVTDCRINRLGSNLEKQRWDTDRKRMVALECVGD